MRLYSEDVDYKLYQGNMLDMLEVLQPNSIDSIVCDPPYGLTSINKRCSKENAAPIQYGKDGSFQRLTKGFMGKEWDGSGIEYNVEAWGKCYQVLKPGGYLLAFGGTRTFHRIACAIEDAGFEIRDTIMYLYGSGFPKSLNIGLAIDKKNGVDNRTGNILKGAASNNTYSRGDFAPEYEEQKAQNEWAGWGTQLKPAYEPIIVARKPCEGSVVNNVQQYSTGGINIDECRVPYVSKQDYESTKVGFKEGSIDKDYTNVGQGFRASPLKTNNGFALSGENGRFPANIIHDNSPEVLDNMPNTTGSDAIRHNHQSQTMNVYGNYGDKDGGGYADEGSAGRYFKACEFSDKDADIFNNMDVSCMPVVVARKPIEKSVVENIEKYGVGGINIDECRVGNEERTYKGCSGTSTTMKGGAFEKGTENDIEFTANGRFPANVIHDGSDNVIKGMPETSSTGSTANFEKTNQDNTTHLYTNIKSGNHFDDSGSASRYFYCAKASKKDRDEGLEAFESFKVNDGRKTEIDNAYQRWETLRKNTHPTVKPIELMQYLIRLVTPKNGTILDCFMGSGSTGKAAMFENRERNAGYKFIGIELTEEYLPICKARIDYGKYKYEYDIKQEQANDIKERGYMQPSIFDFYEGE